ncbi:hypothetical protein V5735_18560 (plasmid) [Haladaptatus sp. SPP-AMP-3]|uniref:hypothetical protein n=1 Tax=Haladaptatus sp. SPP-AMP-3 TaxID=3121295 RepID=UPI003C2B8A38
MQLRQNLSMCIERFQGGVDTTPNGGRFARVDEAGLTFFELDATINSRQRSSLGHTTFSPSGGPIEIYLANETVVENVTWISYEGLVTHELSDAIEASEATAVDGSSNERAATIRTTDAILAREAVANGISLYVSDLYIEQYGGHLNVSALNTDDRNWKRQVVQSVYYSGYRYSKQTDQRATPESDRPNSTAQILHPDESIHVHGYPLRPNLSMNSLDHIQTDRIGELFLRETFRSKGVSSDRATTAADGWTNDRMDYFRANDSTIVTWRVTWENTDEMTEFLETYNEVYDYERVDSLRSITCGKPSRYLTTSEKTVTVVSCSD